MNRKIFRDERKSPFVSKRKTKFELIDSSEVTGYIKSEENGVVIKIRLK